MEQGLYAQVVKLRRKGYENRIIVIITQWRPIYEVIDEDYIKDSNIFPDDFIIECKKN